MAELSNHGSCQCGATIWSDEEGCGKWEEDKSIAGAYCRHCGDWLGNGGDAHKMVRAALYLERTKEKTGAPSLCKVCGIDRSPVVPDGQGRVIPGTITTVIDDDPKSMTFGAHRIGRDQWGRTIDLA